MAHVKRMSNGKDDYYEEMEWRLVHDEKSTHFAGGESIDVYRLRFKASDIKVIIFPDENCCIPLYSTVN
jgi:hypothetical protein